MFFSKFDHVGTLMNHTCITMTEEDYGSIWELIEIQGIDTVDGNVIGMSFKIDRRLEKNALPNISFNSILYEKYQD